MKNKKKAILFSVLVGAFLLSACGGGRQLQASSWPGITVKDDTIYVAYQKQVISVQANNGTELNRIPKETENSTPDVFAPPVFLDENSMLLSTYNNSFLNVNPVTGTENWTFLNQNRFIASPLVTEDAIFLANADHTMYALDHSGNKLWTFMADDPLWAKPAFDGEKLYLGSMDHHLYAIDPKNGSEIWASDLGGTTVGTPAIGEDGTLYIGTFESEVYAIDSQSGEIQWRFPTKGWVWAGPTLSGDTLYVTDLAGYLYAVDSASGEALWNFKGDGAAPGAPLVLDSGIYFTTGGGTLYAMNMDGGVRWSQTVEGKDVELFSPAASAGDLIIVGVVNADQLLIAYTTDGVKQWEYIPGK